jgi:23S rRNA pseudouridine1911/1915/1917 synthase
LITGRNHQIRTQFSEIGNPLFGDQKYGAQYNKIGQQIALWSYKIKIKHPVSKCEMCFQSNPPDEYPWNFLH